MPSFDATLPKSSAGDGAGDRTFVAVRQSTREMLIEPNAYRRAWAAWLPAALPLLENEDYAAALKSFPKPEFATVPFRAAPPPGERRIALMTTAGAYDAQTQAPFAASSAIGDVTHRVFPTGLPDARIALRHGHYDPAGANADAEVLLPRRALALLDATEAAFRDHRAPRA
jgi:hypothetical protein